MARNRDEERGAGTFLCADSVGFRRMVCAAPHPSSLTTHRLPLVGYHDAFFILRPTETDSLLLPFFLSRTEMLPDDTRRRKACQSCTRAKAKCSPFENRHDLCYRCQRLEKECVYDDIIRKRGPKARS